MPPLGLVVGTLPKAYRHKQLAYDDALAMYQLLADLANRQGESLCVCRVGHGHQ
jgi:hypothetical protein